MRAQGKQWNECRRQRVGRDEKENSAERERVGIMYEGDDRVAGFHMLGGDTKE